MDTFILCSNLAYAKLTPREVPFTPAEYIVSTYAPVSKGVKIFCFELEVEFTNSNYLVPYF